MRTLPNVSIPLPTRSGEESPSGSNSNYQEEESPTTKAEADSPHELSLVSALSAEAEADSPHSNQDESPASTANNGLPLQIEGVTNQGTTAYWLTPQTREKATTTATEAANEGPLLISQGGVTNEEEDHPEQPPAKSYNQGKENQVKHR